LTEWILEIVQETGWSADSSIDVEHLWEVLRTILEGRVAYNRRRFGEGVAEVVEAVEDCDWRMPVGLFRREKLEKAFSPRDGVRFCRVVFV